MRLLTAILFTLALGACATNPVTGKKEFSLLSEAEELAIGQQADAEIRREMGVYRTQELQRYVSDIGMRLAQQSHRPNLPWTLHRRRQSRDQRVCGARRLRLHHPRHPAVSGRRVGAGRRARPRDRPRHRPPRGAAVLPAGRRRHRPDGAQHLRAADGAVRGPVVHGPRRAVPEVRPRRRARVGPAGHGVRVGERLGPGRRAAVPLDARARRRDERARRAELAVHAPRARLARRRRPSRCWRSTSSATAQNARTR